MCNQKFTLCTGVLAQGVSAANTNAMQNPALKIMIRCFVRQYSWRPWDINITIAIASQRDIMDMAIKISTDLHNLLPEAKKLNLLHINSEILIKHAIWRNMKKQFPKTVM